MPANFIWQQYWHVRLADYGLAHTVINGPPVEANGALNNF